MNCRWKLSFSTVEQAERTASIIAGIRGGAGKVPVRVYECGCGSLHFTSKGEEEIRSRATTVAVLGVVAPLFAPPTPKPPPPPQPKAKPAPTKPADPKLARASEVLSQSVKASKRYQSQATWLKNQARAAAETLLRHGPAAVDDVIVMLSVAAGLPRQSDPTDRECIAHLKQRAEDKRGWLRQRRDLAHADPEPRLNGEEDVG